MQNDVIFKSDFSIISVSVSIENNLCNRTKEKIVCSCNIFPVIDLNEHINTILYLLRNFSYIYYICFGSGQEPSYNLSKNLFLLTRIMKLMKHLIAVTMYVTFPYVKSRFLRIFRIT